MSSKFLEGVTLMKVILLAISIGLIFYFQERNETIKYSSGTNISTGQLTGPRGNMRENRIRERESPTIVQPKTLP